MKRAARWLGALGVAAIASSCGQTGAPANTTTVQSAVNSNVAVTVRDGASVLQSGVEVFALLNTGAIQASAFTNASGVATLSLPANSYRFKVTEAGSDFFSGAVGHCTTPSCTTAQITITRVDVTVVLTDGTPLANRSVWWETPTGQTGGYVYSDANGHSLIAVPAGSYAFFNEVNGWEFPSGSAGHCVVPGCTTATIVETVPVAVTVRNTSGVPQANVTVAWEDGTGAMGGWEATDASGVVMLSVPQGAITFKVDPDNYVTFSSTPVCNVPGCTSATVVMTSPVTVTVTDTGGAPITGKQVSWENGAGTAGSPTNTNASGVATLTPPNEPVRFKVTVDGTTFYSATTTNCSQPGCTTATISVSQPSVVTVVDGSGNPISGRAVTPTSTEGITSANKTTNSSGQATFRLPFAHWQFKAKCSANNETFFSGNAGHCYIPGGCLTAKIKMPCGQCTGKANGFACDDQNPCTGSSTCQSQFCTGASPMSCSASDQCHDAGACGAETGSCSNPAKANGAICSDGNGCTQTDTCQSGTCTGSNPITCVASDECHDAGTCNPSTGACSNPTKPNGSACSDGNSCTGPDTCQSGSCAPGGNSCASIAVTSSPRTTLTPTLSTALQADDLSVVAGDPVAFTASVTNTGMLLKLDVDANVTNVGATPFTVGGFRQTLEYHAVPSGVWTPFARVVYNSAGNVVPETTLPQLVFWGVFPVAGGSGVTYPPNPGNGNQVTGTTIAAGGSAAWSTSGPEITLPADVVSIVFDPAQSSGVRAVISFDVPSGQPQAAVTPLDYPGVTGAIEDVTVPLLIGTGFDQAHGFSLLSSDPSPLEPGETRIFTGTIATVPFTPFGGYPDDNEAGYRNRLFWAQFGYTAVTRATGHALPRDPLAADGTVHIALEMPSIPGPVKSGPAAINAGLTSSYSVSLHNEGNSPASQITLSDSVDGAPVTISNLTLPSTVAGGATGAATFNWPIPLGRATGPMTDVAAITWKDRNGNLYGPITTSFTGDVTAGHPEGYLSIDVATGFTDTIGISKPIVVTALDPYGHPAPNIAVHFVVTGDNPQTVDIPTGTDGKATFSYSGTVMGDDTVVVSATITTTLITLAPIHVQWAQSVGTPCTGRATPLDIMLVVDVSGSVALPLSEGKLQAAKVAGDRFIDNLTYPRDQIGVLTFFGGPVTFAQLAPGAANAKSSLDGGIDSGILCTQILCPGGSNVAYALNLALDELESPRHRPDAQKVVVYIGDGGADVDPTAAIARLRSSGTRTVALGIGSNIDGTVVRAIADGPNNYFYAPSGAGVDYAFNNLNQDLCRNLAPFVSAGGDQGAYEVRIPSLLTLQGEVHDDGADGDRRLTSEWSLVSGPGPVSFTDASSPVTQVLFAVPGTYVFQLAASDGYLTVVDRATINVDPDPSITGANLAVALSAPGPLETGQSETLTATLTDGVGVPIRDFAVRVTVAGANPVTTTLITNASGVATFTYSGAKPGTDLLHATALGSTFQLDSAFLSLQWTQPSSGGAYLTQGWIGEPLDQAKVTERVPIKLASDVTLTSGTVRYYPTDTPADVRVLAPNVSGAPGTTLATLDTTLLANGTYVIQLDGTDQAGNQKTSVVLVAVTGDYKPGRVVVELTDFTIPIAGLPITVGRRYDSLEKDKVGDFGYGWSLVVGHARLEVNPNFGVTVTLPNGRRATFDLSLHPVTDDFNFNVFAGFFGPNYVGEPGVFGKLTQEGGCPIVRYNPANPANPLTCFILGSLAYAPEFYTYTDPYGTAYRMAASGELKSITDRQGNTLSFEPNGIISSAGKSVTFVRDEQGRITTVDYPALYGPYTDVARYTYDTTGDLVTFEVPANNSEGPEIFHYTYAQHRLLTTVDPKGHPTRTSTYDANGRLATDKDALDNFTTYAYDLDARKTTTTYPDTGAVAQTFDARGLLLTETDQLGHTTTHEYDANRNETKRKNALNEITTATYDDRGNQTSVTDPTGTTHTSYNEQNLPITFTDRLGHVTTIDYDDRLVPRRFADELGTRFTFTNSEQGLPLTIDDAAGKRAYIEYDAAGNVTARTDWLGRTTRASYDEGGRRLTETTAGGAISRNIYNFGFGRLGSAFVPRQGNDEYSVEHAYDANGNLTQEYDLPSIHGDTRRAYNALNQLIQLTHYTEGTTVVYTRDFRGNPLTVTDESGHTTTYEYDLKGNLTKTTFADAAFTTRTYDALDRLASVTDERGNTTRYEYDAGCGCSDRVTKVTDPLEHATITAYDANGRKSSVTDANGHTTSFIYDVRGHVIETDYPDGTSTHEEYDPRGRRISMTDQMGQTTLYGYDDQGQLTSVTDPLTNVTHYTYDLDGNLTSVTDANGHPTTYAYDQMKRKTKRTLPMGQSEIFKYDLAGRLTQHSEFAPSGADCVAQPSLCKWTTMTYDSRDRMLTKVPDPSRGETTHVYTYSPTGMRLTTTDGSGPTTYTYDLRDRMLTKAATAGTLTYTYDPAGNVATIRSSNTNGTSVDYGWDAANQLVSVTDNRVGGTTTSAYTATNRPSTLTQPNGIGLTYSYDALDRVTSMLWRQGISPAFGSWAYTRNERGQRLTSTDITGRAATYAYDSASRLTSETITGDPRGASFNGALSYVLDAVGNRSSRTSTLAALGAQNFSYNANDEIGGDTFDANGNTISSGGHSFAYDFENRLVSKDAGAVTIAYDCDGNRVAKTIGGVTTRYLVDELNPTGYLQVLEEVAAGAVQTRYTYGDRIVSQTRNVSSTAATSFYGYDAHGNITFLADATGAVTDSYDFDSWGGVVAHTGTTLNTRLYAGEEFDPDMGLINLRARQYNPNAGRFLTLDPLMGNLKKPTSLNRYLYTSADPVNFRDPLGLVEFAEGSMLRSGVVGTLTMETTIELGYAAKTTADIIKAAAAAYAAACAMFILANEIFPGPAVPPPPFSMCKINHICRFSGVGAGPMQPTDDPNKFTFELVCKYDCGPPFGEKTIPMPADGKCPAVMRF